MREFFNSGEITSLSFIYSSRGGKYGFLRFWFFMFFKNQKPRKVGFFGFYGFLDIVVFCINYALKPYSYYFFIII